MSGKKSGGRWEGIDDFHVSVSGEYIYDGAVHTWDTPGLPRKKAMLLLWAYTAVASVGIIAAGCVPAAGMRSCPYVLLPYTGALIGQAAVVWLMCRLSAGGDPLRDYIFNATAGKFHLRGVCALSLCALTLAGNGLYLLLNGAHGLIPGTAAFWLLMAMSAAAELMWLRLTARLRWSA